MIPICDCRQFLQFGGHATVGIDIVVGVSIGDGGASQQSALLLERHGMYENREKEEKPSWGDGGVFSSWVVSR